ncbi:AbgT family transporter [Vibrio sp. SCSIO 43135]|uniref:AbgT family transporter n=1 Tax=Vibrio sp. SCSIO 43135 TaxID=2819096 RepID=UPI00207579A1|nr:AbgT family transporter [Vibrio sp. SCSIO 43135]USD42710.1 AbgT family transporter [Vibrio sp. SCSIO 43135]
MTQVIKDNYTKSSTPIIDKIEKFGDKIPHPFYMFIFLCLAIMALSWIVAKFGGSVIHPLTQDEVAVKNLLSGDGLVYMLNSAIGNFIAFKPLGLVLSMMLAVGLVQEVGLADSAIKQSLLNAPKKFVTASIFITGIIGNLASDAAFILVPPLAGIIFSATNRNPVVGIAAGFVAVAAGFTANVFIAGTDVLLSGISTEAASIIAPTEVSPAANWYFMLISVPLLVITGTIITDKYIEPKFDKQISESNQNTEESEKYQVSEEQKSALKWSGIASMLFIGVCVALIAPESSPLRNEDGGLVPSPFLSGIIPIIMAFFILNAIVYGIKAKVITKPSDVPELMARSLNGIGGYIVLVFVIAQFIAWFNWSNLAVYVAVNGAETLSHIQMPKLLMLATFMLLAGVMNLIVFSGSAQWAIMAPVFIPLFMLLDISPEYTQMAYRIADSTTNIISPTNPYIPMVLALIAKYNSNVKFGTFLAMMIPYAAILFTVWGGMFLLFTLTGLPVGPI